MEAVHTENNWSSFIVDKKGIRYHSSECSIRKHKQDTRITFTFPLVDHSTNLIISFLDVRLVSHKLSSSQTLVETKQIRSTTTLSYNETTLLVEFTTNTLDLVTACEHILN